MTEALLVLNPRDIPECMNALRALPIPKCWISYMNEIDAADQINQAVQATSFDRYVIVSDDTIPQPGALHAILEAQTPDRPVVTGYCNLDGTMPDVNLTTNELPPPPPTTGSYQFRTLADVLNGPRLQHTTFAGLALTCVSRSLLLEHPMQVSPLGGQMDYMLSHNLQQAGVPIYAARAGFVWHVKEVWNCYDRNPKKRLLVGIHPSSVTWTDLEPEDIAA